MGFEHELSRRHFIRTTGIAGAGLAGAALVGCGASDEVTPPASGSSAGGGNQQAAAAPTTTPVAGTPLPPEFIVANESEPPDLLPWFANFGGALVTRQVYQTLVEPALTLDADGEPSWEVRPALAESWEDAENTWVFRLRDGVRFHNGEPWNADAAVATYELMSDPDIVSELGKFNVLGRVTKFEKVDDLTVRLETATPGVDGLMIALRLGYSAIPESVVRNDTWRDLAERPVGTGPLRVTAFNRGSEIRGEAYEEYWGRRFPIDRVRWVTRPEASVRALTVRTGEAHFAFNVGAENAAQLEHWAAAAGFQSTGLRLNNAKPPFDDFRVRQAANHAIDREEIARSVFRGSADPASFFAYMPSDAPVFSYDPARARQLLESAGATGAAVNLVYGELRLPEEPQLAEVYKGYLDAAGFQVTLQRLERQAYSEADQAAFADQPHMLIESTSSGNYYEVISSLEDKYGCDGSGTFCDPELQAEWQTWAALPVDDRDAKVAALARTLQEEHAPRVWTAAVRQVHGLAPFVDPTRLPVNLYPLFDDLDFV